MEGETRKRAGHITGCVRRDSSARRMGVWPSQSHRADFKFGCFACGHTCAAVLFLALLLSPIGCVARFVAQAVHPLLFAFDSIAWAAASLPGAAITVTTTLITAVLAGACGRCTCRRLLQSLSDSSSRGGSGRSRRHGSVAGAAHVTQRPRGAPCSRRWTRRRDSASDEWRTLASARCGPSVARRRCGSHDGSSLPPQSRRLARRVRAVSSAPRITSGEPRPFSPQCIRTLTGTRRSPADRKRTSRRWLPPGERESNGIACIRATPCGSTG